MGKAGERYIFKTTRQVRKRVLPGKRDWLEDRTQEKTTGAGDRDTRALSRRSFRVPGSSTRSLTPYTFLAHALSARHCSGHQEGSGERGTPGPICTASDPARTDGQALPDMVSPVKSSHARQGGRSDGGRDPTHICHEPRMPSGQRGQGGDQVAWGTGLAQLGAHRSALGAGTP